MKRHVCHGILLATAIISNPAVQVRALAQTAKEILATAKVHGGLVVVVGLDDPGLLTALRANDSYLVHGLDTDPAEVAGARKRIFATGSYGKVSVGQFDGRNLPYVDNLVNLLVVQEAKCDVESAEMDRVLAPRGVAIVNGKKTVKPVPDDIDEWSHFLHGPDNNALAEDTVVGPPKHMQWRSEPFWGRDHHAEKGTYPTIRTVVSSRGRLFCLIDETESSNMKIPSRWTIVARDAFSGVLLWKKRLTPTKYPRKLEQVWRQLIADGDSVYAVLGTGLPLSELDAVSGEVTRNYRHTEGLKEVIKDHNALFVLCEDDSIVAFEADSGKESWKWNPGDDDAVVRLTLAASDGRVFVKTGKAMSCLSADTGESLWRVPLPGPEKKVHLAYPHEKLLVKDDVVLCSYGGRDPLSLNRDSAEFLGSHPRVREYGGTLGAFSAGDGSLLWETAYLANLESAPGEIYISDGLVWLGPDFAEPRDLRTGKIKRTRPVIERLWTNGHHHRCYPGKATRRYIITAKRGIEMIDIAGEDHSRNNWVRGTCRVGITPCNGLIYAPSHSCGCYMEAKLFAFWALAARRPPTAKQVERVRQRLEKGKAFGESRDSQSQLQDSDWWTYRGGNDRGGSTPTKVAADLKQAWKTELGGKLSAATVAGGRVYVAQIDTHTVYALDVNSGRKLWSFTSGGRVDSPPTLASGLVLFGSRDGYVYCLRASDGEMAWRFLAAPRRLNAVAFNQPESVWPMHGSVLFHQGVVYAAAGRSSYLDGGIKIYGLDPTSGGVICETLVRSEHVGALDPPEDAAKMSSRISQNWPDYKTTLAPDRSDSFAMRGARTDVLVADGESVYLRHMRFDRKLAEQKTKRPHLFATSSLLDGWEHNRSYWLLGTGDFYSIPVAYPWILRKSIQVPHGLMMAFDEKTVWGVHRARREGCTIFAMPRPDPTIEENAVADFQQRTSAKMPDDDGWTAPLGIRARAMVRAGDVLIFGGMSADSFGNPLAPATPERAGEKRGFMRVVSCRDGRTVREMPTASPPVWDGMAVAAGRLFIPCADGSVICLSGR